MSVHGSLRIRPLAAALAVTLAGTTFAGLSLLSATAAHADDAPVCAQPGGQSGFSAGDEGAYTVPDGVHALYVRASGAAGSNSSYGSGGQGATVSTTIPVQPGEVLDYGVATGGGFSGGLSGTAPSGGDGDQSLGNQFGRGGGGATIVSHDGIPLVVAGGGGGSGYAANGGQAGPGVLTSVTATAGTAVFAGADGQNQATTSGLATGGSTSPGIGEAIGTQGAAGNDGSSLRGGSGGADSGGAGGGGGFFGGGGGSFGPGSPGSGGAGSSMSVADFTIIGGVNNGVLFLGAAPSFQSDDATAMSLGQNNRFVICAPASLTPVISSTGTLPDGVSFYDSGNGTAVLYGQPTESGTFPLTLTSTDANGSTATQDFTLTVADTSPTHLGVTIDQASPFVAGTPVTGTITAYDAHGDVATSDNDPIELSSTDTQAALADGIQLSDGVATYTGTLYTAGAQSVSADDATSANGDIDGTSDDVTVTPAAAAALRIRLPFFATAGTPVSATITAVDAWNNVDPTDNGDVSLSSIDEQATLPATVTLVAGTVVVPVTYVGAGFQTLSATETADAGVTGFASTLVQALDFSRLSLDSYPSATAGSSNWLSVDPQDLYGNEVASSDVVRFTSTDPTAVLPADLALDAANDAIHNLEITFSTAGAQSVTVTDLTDPDVLPDTFAVTVYPGVARIVTTVGGDRQSAVAGHNFGATLSVTVRDGLGNPVSGSPVVFTVQGGASFAGASTSVVGTDGNGLAVAVPLTAGATAGQVTVTAAAPLCYPSCYPDLALTTAGTGARLADVDGSVGFTETVTASEAAQAAIAKSSTGTGTATQQTTVTIPAGGSVTLLDAEGNPTTTVVTPDGTYVLDNATGVITFVAAAGFSGTATPVSYRLTDAYNLQATTTYTPTVTAPAPVTPPGGPLPPAGPTPVTTHPLGVAHVSSAARVVLAGATFTATCTVTVPAIRTCQTALTAQVSGRQVVLGRSAVVKAKAGASHVVTVIHLSKLGQALASRVSGVKVTLWASVVKADLRLLSSKRAVALVDKHVLVPTSVLFPTSSNALSALAHRQVKALKSQLAGVRTVTCVGYTDSAGTVAGNLALAKTRATAVCKTLAGRGIKLVVITRGQTHPVAANTTAAGRALNRRVVIQLTY